MELKKILVGLEGIKAKGNVNLEIKGIEKNSKEVKEGYMFVAIKVFQQMDINMWKMQLKMVQ